MAIRAIVLLAVTAFASLTGEGLDVSHTTRDTPEDQAVTRWLRERSFPLRHLEAGNGFEDLKPMREWLHNVRFVGLGETTHGTREFFQLKHRFLEFLVSELEFRGFALESSFAACQRINEYVVNGKGDLQAALSGQGYVPWDTEEFSELVRWMHAYNQSRPPRDRVAFYGLDLWNNGLGREFIRQYLRRHAPDELRPAEDLFARLASLEKKWPMQVTDSDRATLKELAGPLAALTRRLESHGAGADDDRSADARRGTAYARVMEQWVTSNTPEGAGRRSEFMATNLRTLAESLPDTKFVVWAHDSHIRGIGREAPTGRATAGALLGEYMRRAYGGQYFAFGLEFNEGGYLTRDLVEGHPPGDFRVVNVPSAPTESVPWYLSRLGVGNLVVGFRDRTPPHPVLQWLAKAQVVHDVWWGYVPPDNIYAELPLRPYYDGMVFIEKTTATRPTASAKQAVAERAEFRF